MPQGNGQAVSLHNKDELEAIYPLTGNVSIVSAQPRCLRVLRTDTVGKRKENVWYSSLYGEWRGPGASTSPTVVSRQDSTCGDVVILVCELDMGRNGPS